MNSQTIFKRVQLKCHEKKTNIGTESPRFTLFQCESKDRKLCLFSQGN